VDKFVKEPEKIKKWREEQKQRIVTKDAEEEKKMKDMKEVAKKELEEWYKNRQEQLVKTIANNRLRSLFAA
jgi:galactokinase/mevalonate kinase-like predicted kinase